MDRKLTSSTSSWLSLFYRILYWDIRIHDFLSNFLLFLQSLLQFVAAEWRFWSKMQKLNSKPLINQHTCFHDSRNEVKLCRGEVEMVMDRLGLFYDPDGEKLQESFGADELAVLFEEEPSLEEVKEAFNVFDENRDGFIDATELHRVLRCLSLKEGSEVEECRKMISVFDQNGDGLLDINEFVKFMENCLR